MTRPGPEDQIELFGRMTMALDALESCREFAALIPEVRTNMVYARCNPQTPEDVLAIEGRITVIGGMPRAAGRIRFGASGHMARFVIGLMKADPACRAAIDFANPAGFAEWLAEFCRKNNWTLAVIDRRSEPGDSREVEGSSMAWRAAETVRIAGGIVPKIVCDAGAVGKEAVCVIIGKEPIGTAQDLCTLSRAYAGRKE